MSGYYVYTLYKDLNVVYVGSTTLLSNRISCHRSDKDFDSVRYCEVPNKETMLDLEKYGIYKLRPKYNKRVTQFTQKPDYAVHWSSLDISQVCQQELDNKLEHHMADYLKMQAELLGVSESWLYSATVSSKLFTTYDLSIDGAGNKTVVGYTDNRGRPIDELCHSLGLLTFEDFIIADWRHK